MKKLLSVVTICYACSPLAAAQTFEVEGQSPPPASAQRPARPGDASPGIGWGSSIEVGRLARAAENAIRRGAYGEAAGYAQRAVQAAPRNPRMWFLLGYTSRMAGRHQASIEAYRRGLQMEPNSAEGLSGLAQTYIRLGQVAEAQRLLLQVVAAHPRRAQDLLMVGELFMRTNDYPRALQMLQRAAALQPSAHAELLMAVAYMRLGQPARAQQMLDAARRRDPSNVNIYRAAANFHREMRDYAAAVQMLESAPRKTPEVLADLGFSYELAGRRKESADAYARAAQSAADHAGYQLSAAHAFLRLGEPVRTRQFLARAERLDASHYRLHAIRAALARSENRSDEAIREYELALRRLPEGGVPEGQLYPVQLRLNLAELYRREGQDAAAQQQVQLAEQAISGMRIEGPARAEFLRIRASVRVAGNDLEGAETDLREARGLDATNHNASLQLANLLWRTQRKDDAREIYSEVLEADANNRFALESLGYLAREENDHKGAEVYFYRLAEAYPDDHVPYLALGDMYTSIRDFARAEDAYQKAHKLAPEHPVVVANAANAAIEANNFKLAGEWVQRAQGAMLDDARVMRERQRYLFHAGEYRESAQLGEQVLQKLARDRNSSVYLAYALYNLGRFDDVLALVTRYEEILPREANFPLLAGHVRKVSQLLPEAVEDYTRALERDPRMVDAYVNRGYVLNDLQNAERALEDFEAALKLRPEHGVAHLGMAFSNLQLRRGRAALDNVDAAERLLGQSGAIHLARATAYRQQRLLHRAEAEYRAALTYAPDDLSLHLALANTLFHQRRYPQAIEALNASLRLSPDDPWIYAQLADANAHLKRRDPTHRYIAAAERTHGDHAAILMATGNALLILGDREAAMERFTRALDAPDSNRVNTRLAFARLFVREGNWDDARHQVSLAFAEARIGEALPVTADHLIEAANLMLAMNEFGLAERFFARAQQAGAAEQVVAIGLANTYLAQGDPVRAEAHLASLGDPSEFEHSYDYMLAKAAMYRQRRDPLRAMTAFARANVLSGESDVAARQLHEVAGEVGMPVNRRFSVLSSVNVAPLFENSTIYMLDARLFGVQDDFLLPPPRSSLETRWTNSYRFHQPGLPMVSGFFQVRNARGEISLPSEALIIQRNTYDYSFNSGLNPVLRLGREFITFNAGVQYTLRRDAQSAVAMNQNLFRQFVHMSTSTLGNWVTVRGSAYREAGPFTQRDLRSRDLGASLEFTVGRPWGRTALITGYSARNLQFSPLIREFFTTSTYGGLRRQFGRNVRMTVLGEYLRAWRVQNREYHIAQALRPAMDLQVRAGNHWSVDASFAYTRGMGVRHYDNIQSGFYISYLRPIRRAWNDGNGEVPVEYPLRFSFGIQQENFLNFAGRARATWRPVVRLTVF